MDYYEFHYLVKDLSEHLKAEKDASDSQNDQMQGYSQSMKPKMPNMGGFKMSAPKMKAPRL